jgi:hypothetical protein
VAERMKAWADPRGPADNAPARRVRTLLAGLVVAIVVAAGLLVWQLYPSTTRSPAGTQDDGPTFYQAIAAVNTSVAAETGGPWDLYGVWGIASPLPFSPDSLGWPSYNLTVNSCQAQFNGLTLWNGSIPIFNGTYDSGTAPFWQFAFFSNASHSILIATDVSGVARAFPPMAMTSTCAEATSLDAYPWLFARSLTPFPSNSPTMARSAWAASGHEWMTADEPAWEAFVFGYSYWGSANPTGLTVKFGRCGEVGATSVQPVLDVSVSTNGSWKSSFNGTQGCGDVVSLGPPPVLDGYRIHFSNATFSNSTNSSRAELPLAVAYDSAPNDSDAGGLVTWMVTMNLTDQAGQRLEPSASSCSHWVPTTADCYSSDEGWYVVLVSASGSWLDSYPSTADAAEWALPNVALATNQLLIVVAPAAWNTTGDLLSLSGTISTAPVSGEGTI